MTVSSRFSCVRTLPPKRRLDPAYCAMRPIHLTLALALAIATATSSHVHAQQGQHGATFKSNVDLITLDVLVVDRNGKPVKGLTADDFAVTLDGKASPVRAVNYRELVRPVVQPAGVPAAATAAAAPADASTGQRVVLLLLDDLSAKPGDMNGLRASAERLLPTLNPSDRVGVTTTSGLGPRLSPTTDRAAVMAALTSKEIVGRWDDHAGPVYITIPEAIEINRTSALELSSTLRSYSNKQALGAYSRVVSRECTTWAGDKAVDQDGACPGQVIASSSMIVKMVENRAANQLRAFTQAINSMASATAPRVLIVLSSGIAIGAEAGNLEKLEPVSLAAARANVQFYALIETDDIDIVSRNTPERASAKRAELSFLTSGVKTVAAQAGGEAFSVIGQADRFFDRIINETSAVYQLGAEMPGTPLRQFFSVTVAAKNPNLTVRTNARVLPPSAAGEPNGAGDVDDALSSWVRQGGDATGFPVHVATALRRLENGGATQFAVTARAAASIPAPIKLMFALVDAQGAVVQSGQRVLAQAANGDDYWATFALPISSGSQRLRIAMADRNGRIGGAEQVVSGTLPVFGGAAASDLLTTWTDGAGAARLVAGEVLPATAKTVGVAIELYTTEQGFTSEFEIGRDGEAPTRIAVPGKRSGGTLSFSASLPVSALQPGTYLIRAVISKGGVRVGEASKTIRR